MPPLKGKKLGQFSGQIITTILILIVLIGLYGVIAGSQTSLPTVALSELAHSISAGEVQSINVHGDDLDIALKNGEHQMSKKEAEASLSETFKNYGVAPEALQQVKVTVANPSGFTFWLLNLLPFIAPIIFILFFFWLISKQVRGATMQAFSFGQSKAKIIDPNDTSQRITFKDVAGVKEAKEELLEIVDFLKSPKKFLDIGARIPKGVLLMGAPGTGKTLLARAVAGEARVPFLFLSGSDFVEMFVGVGASRVRDLFRLAKKLAPSIVFIDEIDAIGRHRGSGLGGGHDEREQTLNQILVEMDGFEPTEKLIVMAATNRPDVLDPALLRPGRFDRRVILDNPDVKDREEILKIYARQKPLGEDVNLQTIAQRTPGFTGADLANLMNEGAILAARENRQKITQYDLVRSVEKVMLGPERKSHLLSEKEKKITAYHEMGHAILASLLEHSDPVHKVSIISRGRAAGYTLKLPDEDRKLQAREEFLADIVVSLGGYATEQIIFGDITTGAAGDIAVATALARDMVTKYGMSEKLGPIAFDIGSQKMFIGIGAMTEKLSSEAVSAQVDSEVSKIITEALAKARELLNQHRQALDHLSAELIKIETIDREDFEKLLILNGIAPKPHDRIEPSAGLEVVV
ncbi:MAG: ATP-dependent zinc metalloprotease FtsH [Candidatus Vogelbacteria bacterium]|nr:ATP-dependent zinc metalloprotease FtsH [Candidatus Vogelbacteria bacterium]